MKSRRATGRDFFFKNDDDTTCAWSFISQTCGTNRPGRLARTQSLLLQLRVLRSTRSIVQVRVPWEGGIRPERSGATRTKRTPRKNHRLARDRVGAVRTVVNE